MQTLRDSELRYRRLFEAAQDGILILDARTGMIEDVNPYLIKMLGYSREEFVKKKLWEVGAFRDMEASKDAFEALQENEYIRYEDLPLKTKGGQLIQVEFVSNVYLVGDEKVIQCDIRDITEHRQIIAALQANEKKYHDLVNQSPDGIFIIESSGNILTVNKAICRELEFSEEELLSMNIWDIIPEQYLDQYKERLTKILEGQSLVAEAAEYEVHGKDGKIHYIEVLSAPHYSGKAIIGFQGIARDITARRQAEEALRLSEEKYHALVDEVNDGFYVTDSLGVFTFANSALARLYGVEDPQALVGRKFSDFVVSEVHAELGEAYSSAMQTGCAPEIINGLIVRSDGIRAFIEVKPSMIVKEGQIVGTRGVVRDVTERRQAADALRESEERYRLLVESLPDGVVVESQGRVVFSNPASAKIIGAASTADLIGKPVMEFVHPDYRELALARVQESPSEGTPVSAVEEKFVRLDGTPIDVEVSAIPFSYAGEPAMLTVFTEITRRKQAEARIQRQLEYLTALSAIDRFIAASFNLKLSLSEILKHVTMELGVDAADILILNSISQMLVFGAGRGLPSKADRKTQVHLSRSYAGRAVLERQLVQIPNLREAPDKSSLTKLLTGEDFACYYGVPLIVKGRVKGVLEIFHRAAIEPDAEWLDFLNTLAGRAAIAIENAALFEDVQRINSELMLAYETTLEGWSHALDLRDKETEGHTQRVTEMTVRLARAFGLSDAELVNVRRGGLLHDIGKMGVPDRILLKAGALTGEEWKQMRMHPVFAYDLLSHIAYLRDALDIPYCHHEKWDGTGYPRGLKGEEIPLSARIFAVVDVWDALCSDRPYRAGWSEAEAREYIRSSSGTHFDPQVVDLFLQVAIPV